jgi:bifunctional UDP-N-acetylglucosamine pyrophosphorylase / glucosamine-1-phosphate N-acetyltransferase
MANVKQSVGAIILAAGKGTRMKSETQNKVALEFHGKPIITYGVELCLKAASQVVVVVGAMSESVKSALKGFNVRFAQQTEQLGTGHAAQVGFEAFADPKPEFVLIGYGDHMMFYKLERLRELVQLHKDQVADITLLTTMHTNPNSIAWARIVRDGQNNVVGIVEQKDTTKEEKKIQEVNPGFYCFSYRFLEKFLPLITRSSATNELYLTDLLQLASKHGKKIVALQVPFDEVGIGVNRPEELGTSQELYKQVNN